MYFVCLAQEILSHAVHEPFLGINRPDVIPNPEFDG
jgi:hypothetical protein